MATATNDNKTELEALYARFKMYADLRASALAPGEWQAIEMQMMSLIHDRIDELEGRE